MGLCLEELEKKRTLLHNKIAEKNDCLFDPQVLTLSKELDEYINEHFYQKELLKAAKEKVIPIYDQ